MEQTFIDRTWEEGTWERKGKNLMLDEGIQKPGDRHSPLNPAGSWAESQQVRLSRWMTESFRIAWATEQDSP